MKKNNALSFSRPLLSVKDLDFEEIISFLKKTLKAKNVKEAYIFGSFATKQIDYWSDIDILIVYETNLPFIERSKEFIDLFNLGIPVDILVYTPEEFHNLIKTPTGFWKEFINTNMKII